MLHLLGVKHVTCHMSPPPSPGRAGSSRSTPAAPPGTSTAQYHTWPGSSTPMELLHSFSNSYSLFHAFYVVVKDDMLSILSMGTIGCIFITT